MQKLQPKLRFPQFEKDWEIKKLGDFTNWSSGGTPSKQNSGFWNGKIPWISATSMRGSVYSDSELKITELGLRKGSRLAKKGTLLILVRGSMLFNKIPIGITGVDVAFNQDLKSIEVQKDSFSTFILYWFSHQEHFLLDLVTATGIGAGKLDLRELKNLTINLPSLPEQTKIASFLTTVDEKISGLKKQLTLLERYKKGVMQKIFSQKLRFKDENGNDFPDWEEKKLGEVMEERNTQQPKSIEFPLMSFVANNGITEKGERYDREFLVNDELNKKYKRTEFGDFIYSSNNLETGSIGINKFGCASISPVYSIFKMKNGYHFIFIGEFLRRKKFINNMIKYRQGVVYGQWRIHEKEFLQIADYFPHIDEQQKIASFLSSIDAKIENCQGQIKAMEKWKKGLLQQMFV